MIKKLVGKGLTNTYLGKKAYNLILFIKPKYVKIEGMKIYIHKKRDIISDSIFLFKVWEENQTKLIKSKIKKGDTVFDIGSNIGYYTALMSKWVGKTGKVISIEPDDRNFSLLLKTISKNKLTNVIPIKAVANDYTGMAKLNINNNPSNNSLVEKSNGIKEVLSIKIDDFFNEKPSLVKLDVEGVEEKVILGGINNFKDSLLIVEDGNKFKDKYKLNIISFDYYDKIEE